ncbi:MAG: beta-galactosidase [Anaerolineae bacterium]|nr:beta-galactosidase [Anaerolineae bacterium]
MKLDKNWFLFVVVILGLLLSACQPKQTVPTPVAWESKQTATPPVAAQAVTPTPTVVTPTATGEATATPAIETTAVEATATPLSESPTPTATPPPTQSSLMTSPDYGIQAFMWWRPEVATRDLGLIKDMGFRWVKQIFAWNAIEGAAKGHFDWSATDRIVDDVNRYGLKLLVRIDRGPVWAGGQGESGLPTNLADFGDFCTALASRYKGKIHAYQIWNEPNLAREWGGKPPNPAEYVQLLKVAYEAIKSVDPNAIVISAGLTPTGTNNAEAMPDDLYLEGMYQAGFQQYCDMLGLHGAGFKAPPEMSPDELMAAPGYPYGDQRFFCFRHVEDMRKIVEKHNDGARRVAILEFGWTTDTREGSPYAWHGVSQQEQADYMVRAYQYAKENWQPWIGLMSLIYIADPYWTQENEEYWWAITDPNYPTPWTRPAYEALKVMPK